MKSVVSIACLLVLVQPANACHRFAHWAYPFPQRCGAVTHAARTLKAALADIKIDPVLIPPGWDEEDERREALWQAEHELEGRK